MSFLVAFFKREGRTAKFKKNIVVSGAFKAADTLIYLLLVPLTLGYLNAYEYGIWITLNSILCWIDSFDIGLGNGLRNRLAEALAKDDKVQARKYVSTTLFMLIILVIVLSAIGFFIISQIDWFKLLNVDAGTVVNLTQIITISFCFFCLNFVLKFVGNVYQALQIPSAMYAMNFFAHLLSLVVIWFLTLVSTGNLLLIAIVYSAAPPVVYAIAYPVTFKKLFRYLDPSIKFFDKSCIKDLFNLSLLFFVIQLASLVLFSLSSIIISHKFGPVEVTPYNIVQRYFSVIPMLTNIILAPLWSATTDAYSRNDMKWIKDAHRTVLKLLAIVAVVLTLMVILSSLVYDIWIGDKVEIAFTLTLMIAIYSFILMWSQGYSYLLNGMGKLKLQAINTILVALVFYPLCNYFGSIYYVPGIILGMCLVNLSGAILNTIQYHLVINNKARGIWAK